MSDFDEDEGFDWLGFLVFLGLIAFVICSIVSIITGKI